MATQQEIAEHLDITQAAVSQHVAAGHLPKSARGEYDKDACRVTYIRHLRSLASGNDEALSKARTRLAEEQADAAAIANAERRRELLPRAAIAAIWKDIVAEAKAKLRAIPTRLAPQLATMKKPAAIKEKLADVIDEALTELSQPRAVPTSVQGDGRRSEAELGAATQTDGEPVGGQTSTAKRGVKRRAG